MLFGGIEAGGTKMVCAVADENGTLIDRMTIPTETPEVTLSAIARYFHGFEIAALGIGCFGPIDLRKASPKYGYILKTNKTAWIDCDIVGFFKKEFDIPIGFDTDVNGAILGEVVWGAAKGCENAIYITVGTGVGVGAYINGKLVHGLMHPEAGHVLVQRHPDDNYEGNCCFHKNCIEGLAAGPAIEKRWGKKAAELADKPEVWELESYYLAQAITDYIMTYSPEKIILWGGVMHQPQMFPLVRCKVQEMLGEYVDSEFLRDRIDEYIVPPELGDNPGIMGAVKLGMEQVKISYTFSS